MRVSVIIPTFNRAESLRRLLGALAAQQFDPTQFEVLVVDDGSTDTTSQVCSEAYPFELRHLYQPNQGDARARNTAVASTRAELLVFLDDDIVLHPNYLFHIVRSHSPDEAQIIIGHCVLWVERSEPQWQQNFSTQSGNDNEILRRVSFTDVCSNNMSLTRKTFLSVGDMTSLDFSGSSIWCDVEFAYRAHMKGVDFLESPQAVCWHVDYVARNFETQKKRMREAGLRAALLFHRHPGLARHLPMFEDKLPIDWRKDPVLLVLRKSARRISSTKMPLQILEKMNAATRFTNPKKQSETISRWILGGQLYSGFRAGASLVKERFRPDYLLARRS